MNILYAKTVLYAYSCIDELCAQVDELVEKKAYSSMDNYKPCIDICDEILGLTEQKDKLISLYHIVNRTLDSFSKEERDMFDYRYFKRKPKSYFKDIDVTSRTYFRKQSVLAQRFAIAIEVNGLNDNSFEETYLKMSFFKELYSRVKNQELKASKKQSFDSACKKIKETIEFEKSFKRESA